MAKRQDLCAPRNMSAEANRECSWHFRNASKISCVMAIRHSSISPLSKRFGPTLLTGEGPWWPSVLAENKRDTRLLSGDYEVGRFLWVPGRFNSPLAS